jgi:hypothetical protein
VRRVSPWWTNSSRAGSEVLRQRARSVLPRDRVARHPTHHRLSQRAATSRFAKAPYDVYRRTLLAPDSNSTERSPPLGRLGRNGYYGSGSTSASHVAASCTACSSPRASRVSTAPAHTQHGQRSARTQAGCRCLTNSAEHPDAGLKIAANGVRLSDRLLERVSTPVQLAPRIDSSLRIDKLFAITRRIRSRFSSGPQAFVPALRSVNSRLARSGQIKVISKT